MKKQSTTTPKIKAPKSVEIKTALPWTLIIIAIVGFVGFYQGWTARSTQVTEVRAQVSEQFETLSKAATVKK